MVRNLELLIFKLTGLISVGRRERGRRRGQTEARFNTIFYITESKFIFLQALATQSLFAKALIFAQLALRISRPATTRAKLYIVATAWFGRASNQI